MYIFSVFVVVVVVVVVVVLCIFQGKANKIKYLHGTYLVSLISIKRPLIFEKYVLKYRKDQDWGRTCKWHPPPSHNILFGFFFLSLECVNFTGILVKVCSNYEQLPYSFT